MLVHTSPFRELDSLFSQLSGPNWRSAGSAQPTAMDAYRRDDNVWVHLDMPGVAADTIDVSVERNVLSVTAERTFHRQEGDRVYLAERQHGSFRRQVTLGDGLDTEGIEADYHDGVLTLRIPVAQKAQPRKIEIRSGAADVIETTTATETDEA